MTEDLGAVLYATEDGIATITLNRPDAMNAMNRELSAGLNEALRRVAEDESVRVAILTGAGRAFCAGADLKERAAGGNSGAQWHDAGRFINRGVEEGWTPKPVIAAINGHALAGGLELALRCDLLIASDRARFGVPEIRHGFFPGAGAPQRLPRAIPRAVAMEMLLLGDPIDAETALRVGLVSRVVAADALMPTARGMAERIAGHNPAAVLAMREVAYASEDLPLPMALRFGSAFRWIVGQTDAAMTGSQDWKERRSNE
ncbi:MAG: enoyl-CoA hydratase/isomerase family protein [Dehalococcoidia bacterium]